MSDDQDGCEWVNVSSGTGLPRVVLDKRPLNGCVCVCVCVCVSIHCEEDSKDFCLHDGLVNQDASWHEGWAETTEDIEVLVLLSLDLKLTVTSKRVLD